MFGADHVSIGVEGVSLMPDCKGGTGEPVGMGDVFVRRYCFARLAWRLVLINVQWPRWLDIL